MPIGARAWIGDGRHGASLAPDGAIDWFSRHGVTGGPDLWRLLDESGPAVRVGAVRDDLGARLRLPGAGVAYRRHTNVVETVATGAGGRSVSVVDFMPWSGPGLDVRGAIVRLMRAVAGPVEIEVEVMAGPDRRPGGSTRKVAVTPVGLNLAGLLINSPVRFEPSPLDRDTPRWRARATLDPGQELVVTIGLDQPLSPGGAHRLLEETEMAWRSWLRPLSYTGPYQDAVAQALLSIRGLTGPGGAPSGAGTTSLPRRVGTDRNSDARWVQVTAAARAARVMAACGLVEDADAAEIWLREMVRTAHLPWPAWLDADGQPVPEQEQIPLQGWQRNEPVVAGRNPTVDLGAIGQVVAAIGAAAAGRGGRPDDPGPLSAAFDELGAALDWALDHWRQPDSGRWELTEPAVVHTGSRLWLLSALDRMVGMARSINPLDLRAATWQGERRELLSWLETEAAADGWLSLSPRSGEPDAAALAAAWSGPWPAHHPVVVATVDAVIERLSSGGFLYRHADRFTGADHPDLEASLLGVRALAALGRWDQAHERMEAVVGAARTAGPGLLAETVDPVAGRLYGNFPATAAHLALVEAALALDAGPR